MCFSKYDHKVHILARGESLVESMSQYLIDQIDGTDDIEVLPFYSVIEAKGDTRLELLRVKDSQTGEIKEIKTNSLNFRTDSDIDVMVKFASDAHWG